jgi:hypothetical protein
VVPPEKEEETEGEERIQQSTLRGGDVRRQEAYFEAALRRRFPVWSRERRIGKQIIM